MPRWPAAARSEGGRALALSTDAMATLLAAAIRLSGLPAVDLGDLPPIFPLPRGELNQVVCSAAPVRCSGLMSAFDTQRYRIVVDNLLNFDEPDDASFLVHEFVHVLQFRSTGSTAFTSCTAVLESERQAYAAQNDYLREHDRPARHGEALRFSRCRSQ
ncbi:MAG: hypothetical protein JWM30_2972 [Burkholderia sp.]|jgi:hypothetical protein|nr:hypothetical protein [Burkholderia sp.]